MAANAGPTAEVGALPNEAASRKSDVDNARATALSALRNDRFRSMLSQISAPGFSDTLMRMQPAGGANTSLAAVQARYAESSE